MSMRTHVWLVARELDSVVAIRLPADLHRTRHRPAAALRAGRPRLGLQAFIMAFMVIRDEAIHGGDID